MALWQLLFCSCLLVLLSNTSSLTISNTSKGLYNCVAENAHIVDCGESAVEVLNISAVGYPCCRRRDRGCAACLQVRIWLKVATTDDEGGDDDDNDDDGRNGEEGSSTEDQHVTTHMSRGQKSASLKVCSTVPLQLTHCQCVECGVQLKHGNGIESVVLERDVPFDGMLHVTAKANRGIKNVTKNITARGSTDCKKLGCRDASSDPPKLVPKVDLKNGEVKMKVEKAKSRPVHMCSKPKGAQLCKAFNGTLPLHSITPCLCIQAWWKDKDDRSENCPFSGQNRNINFLKGLPEENALANVSSSLELGRTHSGVAALWYNVSVPCQGTVEVLPCHMVAAGLCQDALGGRHLYQEGDRAWCMATNGLWVLSGAFENIHSNLPPCIKVKVMDKELGPWCVEYTRRWHWSIPIFALMMVLGLFLLGLYVKRTTLEKYFQKWQRTSLLQAGRGHVLLLHPPCGEGRGAGERDGNAESSVTEQVLLLGSALKALGFSVSLDLWSHTELGSVGPVPWLHAQMELLRTRGGRAVLVLSRGALEQAEEWSWLGRGGVGGGDRGLHSGGGVHDGGGGQHEDWGRYGGGGGRLEEGGEVGGVENEVFSTALSCLWEDHRRGCAHRRFSLVQFDSHSPFPTPPHPHGPGRSTTAATATLPPLFQGLSLYSLPRDSRAFVRGVMAERQGGDGVLQRCWQSRWMSRELRRRLQTTGVYAANGTGEHLSRVLEENSVEESVPLQP
ncbi:uncharacterized protein il17rc [Engraulis encrasicolus]|uniref:uncharacterized protein il17rc n=1 Tax=Engraulis encrasicolus TaxID=184585 RepID=UPI002FD4A271